MDGASTTVSMDGSTEADEDLGPFTDDSDFGAAAALAWAEANGNDSLSIVCAYHKLEVPPRGGSVVFQPLDHLQPLAYERPAVIPASLTGGRHIDLALCKVSVNKRFKWWSTVFLQVGWLDFCRLCATVRWSPE